MTTDDPNKQNLSVCIARADCALTNDGTLEQLHAQIDTAMATLDEKTQTQTIFDKDKPASLTITRPTDWHHHFRDGPMLALVAPHISATFARAIAMPNLVPPVTTAKLALEYRERILAALPAGSAFEPLMTLYLTDNTTPEEIRAAMATGKIFACKLYERAGSIPFRQPLTLTTDL